MPFVADLHVHSYLSRATSRALDLEHLHGWAQRKGFPFLDDLPTGLVGEQHTVTAARKPRQLSLL